MIRDDADRFWSDCLSGAASGLSVSLEPILVALSHTGRFWVTRRAAPVAEVKTPPAPAAGHDWRPAAPPSTHHRALAATMDDRAAPPSRSQGSSEVSRRPARPAQHTTPQKVREGRQIRLSSLRDRPFLLISFGVAVHPVSG